MEIVIKGVPDQNNLNFHDIMEAGITYYDQEVEMERHCELEIQGWRLKEELEILAEANIHELGEVEDVNFKFEWNEITGWSHFVDPSVYGQNKDSKTSEGDAGE